MENGDEIDVMVEQTGGVDYIWNTTKIKKQTANCILWTIVYILIYDKSDKIDTAFII